MQLTRAASRAMSAGSTYCAMRTWLQGQLPSKQKGSISGSTRTYFQGYRCFGSGQEAASAQEPHGHLVPSPLLDTFLITWFFSWYFSAYASPSKRIGFLLTIQYHPGHLVHFSLLGGFLGHLVLFWLCFAFLANRRPPDNSIPSWPSVLFLAWESLLVTWYFSSYASLS